jgi:hypothetical protein
MIRAIRRNMLKNEVGTNKINTQWRNLQNIKYRNNKELRIFKNNGIKAWKKYIG